MLVWELTSGCGGSLQPQGMEIWTSFGDADSAETDSAEKKQKCRNRKSPTTEKCQINLNSERRKKLVTKLVSRLSAHSEVCQQTCFSAFFF